MGGVLKRPERSDILGLSERYFTPPFRAQRLARHVHPAPHWVYLGGDAFLSLGTVTWNSTYALPGRGPGLAKLLLTSKTPSVAPAIPGPRRSPLDPHRHRQCAPVGLVAPVSGLLFVCHRAPGTRDLLSHSFLLQRVPISPLLSLLLIARRSSAARLLGGIAPSMDRLMSAVSLGSVNVSAIFSGNLCVRCRPRGSCSPTS